MRRRKAQRRRCANRRTNRPPAAQHKLYREHERAVEQPIRRVPQLRRTDHRVPIPRPPAAGLLTRGQADHGRHRKNRRRRERNRAEPRATGHMGSRQERHCQHGRGSRRPGVKSNHRQPPVAHPVHLYHVRRRCLRRRKRRGGERRPRELRRRTARSRHAVPQAQAVRVEGHRHRRTVALVLRDQAAVHHEPFVPISVGNLWRVPSHEVILISLDGRGLARLLVELVLQEELQWAYVLLQLPAVVSEVLARHRSSVLCESLVPAQVTLSTSTTPSSGFPNT